MTEPGDEQVDAFLKAKPREESFVGRVGPPPPRWKKIATIAAIALALGAVLLWHFTSPKAALWLFNPGPEATTVVVGSAKHTIAPGDLIELEERLGAIEVKIESPERPAPLLIKLDSSKETTIVDLAGDAGFAVVDASWMYLDQPQPANGVKTLTQADRVHVLPFPPQRLVRPGQPPPKKGSPELEAFKRGDEPLEVYKVFRVAGSRLGERDGRLNEILTEAVTSGSPTRYENLKRTVPTQTATRTGS